MTLFAVHTDGFLYRDKLKWNEAYSHKFVAAWMRVLVAIFISYVSCVLVNNKTESSGWFEKHDGNWVCKWLYNGFDEILGVLLSTPPSGPMKSVGSSHGSLSLQFLMMVQPVLGLCTIFERFAYLGFFLKIQGPIHPMCCKKGAQIVKWFGKLYNYDTRKLLNLDMLEIMCFCLRKVGVCGTRSGNEEAAR
jgi:hypothetical protein